jgi:hypothetical protein
MDAKEALDLFKISAMTPNPESNSTRSEQYLFYSTVCGPLPAAVRTYVDAYVCQSR